MGEHLTPKVSRSDIRRFRQFIDKTPGQGPQGECWTWSRYRDKAGYGQFFVGGEKVLAHRLAWRIKTGSWPKTQVLHKCDHPPCVRHLFTGTQQANMLDAVAKGRMRGGSFRYKRGRTHCDRGHEFTASNTRIKVNGVRECRACARRRLRRYQCRVFQRVR
jgi:hypothetical protein